MNLGTYRIGVLCGGLSREREISLRSGANVLAALQRLGLDALSLDVDHDIAQRLRESGVTLAFIALHGRWGEDGCIQGMLEMMGIPYTGSGVLASALAMNKLASKRVFSSAGIPTPAWCSLRRESRSEDCRRALEELDLPLVLKPLAEGSSIAVSIAKTRADFLAQAEALLNDYEAGMCEQFVQGTEVTTGVLGSGSNAQALPVLQLVPKNEFYDYEAKYTRGMTEFILPARLPGDSYAGVQETAVFTHKAIGARGVSRVDAIVTPDGTQQVIEVNTLPGMTDTSDLPAQAATAGIGFEQLVERILLSALEESTEK